MTDAQDADSLVTGRPAVAPWVLGTDSTGRRPDDLGRRRIGLGESARPHDDVAPGAPDLSQLLGGGDLGVDDGVTLECSVDAADGTRGWLSVHEDGGVTVGRHDGDVEASFPGGVRAWWLDDRRLDDASAVFDLVLDGPPLVRTPLPRVYRAAVLLALTRTLGPRTAW